ncbi:MAG: hypothetical protein GYA55_14050 [SAR324 cluster bacterium]|uniref:Type II toxin-antitoxin system RelE/ParE family toxin n=1 Tax=SAR324 cluster bacterium TaxID=2024889 RepID=A0A7X9FU71_9DELT|nr:hypothetical protein [SAR324 cluster bacterium]
MTQIMQILDEYGIIYEASSRLPENLWDDLILSLSELEDNECHRIHKFPITRLHRIAGLKEEVYRADVKKSSCWRIHLQYGNKMLILKQLSSPEQHDSPIKYVQSQSRRFKK